MLLTNEAVYGIMHLCKARNKDCKGVNKMTQYEKLNKQLLKACFNKYSPATNTKRISKIASQMRYIENNPGHEKKV